MQNKLSCVKDNPCLINTRDPKLGEKMSIIKENLPRDGGGVYIIFVFLQECHILKDFLFHI